MVVLTSNGLPVIGDDLNVYSIVAALLSHFALRKWFGCIHLISAHT